MSKKKIAGDARKALITEAGAKLASKHGAINVTRRMVAEAAKVSEALVSAHMGASADAQKAYAKQAKKMGLALPDKETAATIGKKLRAHGPRDKRDTRKRSIKEVKAIKRTRETKPAAPATRKPRVAPVNQARKSPAKAPASAPENKVKQTAARAPKAPPTESSQMSASA